MDMYCGIKKYPKIFLNTKIMVVLLMTIDKLYYYNCCMLNSNIYITVQ
jgi:hypothetical protein